MNERKCEWCGNSLEGRRADAKTCSKRCRQALHRFRVEPAQATAERPIRVAYADPPYPGLAKKYYNCAEVDHERLVLRMSREFPDGWALSTSAKSLRSVLLLCPPDARVCPWFRGARAGKSHRARNAWEPLIVVGGRAIPEGVAEDLTDTLWMFRQLGLLRGDELVDLFPGSGAVTRAWQLYTSASRSGELPSRLAEATRHDEAPPGASSAFGLSASSLREIENEGVTRTLLDTRRSWEELE